MQVINFICIFAEQSRNNYYMKYTISFEKDDVTYYCTVFKFRDGSYEVLEFYSFVNYKSIDLDWTQFKTEIESLIQ